MCPIGIGNCSIYNFYILGAFILHLLEDYLLSIDDIKDNYKNNLFGFSPKLKKHKLVRLLYKYIGFIIFGTLFYFIQNPKDIRDINNNLIKDNGLNLRLRYSLKTNKSFKSNKYFKELLIIGIIYSLQALVRKILGFFGFAKFDLWIFNIIFIFILMKKNFKIDIYKHQKYSLIFIFISNFILLIWSNLVKSYVSIKENKENEIKKINGYYYSKEIIGNDYFFHGAFFLFIYIIFIILSIANPYSKVLSKKLMDFKYQSHYKIIIIIGIFGLFFTTIIILFTSIFKCDDNIKKNICKINGHLDSIYEYYLNIKDQYKEHKTLFFVEILIVIPLYAFVIFLQFTFEYLIIFYLNPYYILISDCAYFSTQQILKVIFQFNNIENYFYINFTADILALLSYFIFLEIIELRFCELNKDIRKNIIKRQYSSSINFIDNDLEIEDYYIDNLENTIYNENSLVDMNIEMIK